MIINNWTKVEEIIAAGIEAGEDYATIGITIIDSEDRINVIRINDTWSLMDEDGVVGRFNSPAEAWEFVGRICVEDFLSEQ